MAVNFGFFDSYLVGDTFDRVYGSSTFNEYFEGLISQNGIFTSVGKQCIIKIPDGFDPDTSIDAIKSTEEGHEGQLTLTVGSGKAIVDSHWVTINPDYNIYLDPPDVAGSTKYYMITLRCDTDERTCYVHVEQGVSMMAFTQEGFDPVTKTFIKGRRFTDILLGFVTIPDSVRTISDIVIENKLGSPECPYISHLVIGADEKDIDLKLAQYNKEFTDWLTKVLESQELDLTLKHHRYCSTEVPGILNINVLFQGEYSYNPADHITIYVNGLMLRPDEYSISSLNGLITFTNIENPSDISEITIDVIRSTMFNITNGDAIEY